MKFANGYKLTPFCVLPGCACFLSVANASDVDDLRALLHGFLVTADEEAAHRRFRADDRVYTSSEFVSRAHRPSSRSGW